MSLRKKLLFLVILPAFICTTFAVVVSSVKIRKQGIQNLEEKSSAILSLNIKEYVLHHQTATSIFENDTDSSHLKENHSGNPTEIQNYEFRIASPEPENQKHTSTKKENLFISKFKKDKKDQINYIDKETNTLWVMRPVFINSQGCFDCHTRIENQNGTASQELRGIFIMKSDMKHVQKEVKSGILEISALGLVIIILSIFVGFLFVNRITTSVNQINQVSKKVSEGDLCQKVCIDTKDELQELGNYINSMIQSLNKILLEVKESAQHLTDTTREIADTSEKISMGAKNQSDQFNELNISFQNTNENAIKVAGFINQSVEHAELAVKSMNKTIQSMKNIENSSVKINEAIQIIKSIAEKTDILAINAAIEAARANEHGRGFAVVSAEVRKLAEITSHSSSQINQVTNNNLLHVNQGVKIAQDAERKINEIRQTIAEVAMWLKDLNQVASDQSNLMNKNNSITVENAYSAEHLHKSSHSLDDQANQLMELVQYFKLNNI